MDATNLERSLDLFNMFKANKLKGQSFPCLQQRRIDGCGPELWVLIRVLADEPEVEKREIVHKLVERVPCTPSA